MVTTVNCVNGFREKINCFLIACLIESNLIVNAISDIVKINNLFPFLCFSIGLCYFVLNFDFFHKKVNKKFILFTAVFGAGALIGYFLIDNASSRQFFLCFIAIGIPTLILSDQRVETKPITRSVLWINILTLFHAVNLLRAEAFSAEAGSQMGTAYSYVPLLIFSALLLLTEKKDATDWFLSIAGLIVSVGIIAMQMTRGAILCILVFAFLEFCILFKKSRLKIIIIALIVLLLIFYFAVIRQYLMQTQWYYYIFVLKSNDIFNGRLDLFKLVWQSNSLLGAVFGNGIGSYQNALNSASVSYPHNLILQIFYEQGFFVAVWYICVIIRSLRYVLNPRYNKSNRQYILALFSCAIVKLMVSDYFWISPIFWLYSGYMISGRYMENENSVRNVH